MVRKRNTPGFTLVEVVVVITIIIILSGMVVPTISAFLSNRKLKAVTSRLVRGLYQARARAITEHNNTFVFFFNDGILSVGERAGPVEYQSYYESEREMRNMCIRLRFAGETITYDPKATTTNNLVSELPPFKKGNWITKSVSRDEAVSLTGLRDRAVFFAFKSDGTIEVGSGSGPGDILSFEFMGKNPANADIVIEEINGEEYPRGWIDIRPTGNISSKVAVGTLAEEIASEGE